MILLGTPYVPSSRILFAVLALFNDNALTKHAARPGLVALTRHRYPWRTLRRPTTI
jgi:hypothetical protein